MEGPMYDKKLYCARSLCGGIYYPRFGGEPGYDRHWDVEDVKRLLFGPSEAKQSRDEKPPVKAETQPAAARLRLVPPAYRSS